MVCTGKDGSHPCPPGLEATGRGRGCSLSIEQGLTLDLPAAQDSPPPRFFSPHLCVKVSILEGQAHMG